MEKFSIYFGDIEVVITNTPPDSHHTEVYTDILSIISSAKIRKKVETRKCLVLVTSNPQQSFEQLKREFIVVEAAGGAVQNKNDELLMINLRNRWDLPKGHIEFGEEANMAALREVYEETGVVAELLDIEPITETWHAYDTYGCWELKRTRWWRMRYLSGELKPQCEEGISRVEWCSPQSLEERLKTSYATIKQVVWALNKVKDK